MLRYSNERSSWEFDGAYGGEASQGALFAEVSSLIATVVEGFSVCVMAYGATGSGPC